MSKHILVKCKYYNNKTGHAGIYCPKNADMVNSIFSLKELKEAIRLHINLKPRIKEYSIYINVSGSEGLILEKSEKIPSLDDIYLTKYLDVINILR